VDIFLKLSTYHLHILGIVDKIVDDARFLVVCTMPEPPLHDERFEKKFLERAAESAISDAFYIEERGRLDAHGHSAPTERGKLAPGERDARKEVSLRQSKRGGAAPNQILGA
jgi:hypothetical protein